MRIIAPVAAGGTGDIIVRLMGQGLSERLDQPFVIENRPGAGTNVGTEVVVRAPADGYTLLLVIPPAVINATLYEKLDFNFIRDIVPVASISLTPGVVVASRQFPVTTIPSLLHTPRPSLAGSTWLPEGLAARNTSMASCSR